MGGGVETRHTPQLIIITSFNLFLISSGPVRVETGNDNKLITN